MTSTLSPARPDDVILPKIPTWALLVLSGLLLGFAYPPNPVWLFGSFGLAPLVIAVHRAKNYKQVIRWCYGSLFIFSATSSWWIGSWQAKADPFLMISCVLLVVVHPFFFMIPLIGYYFVRKRMGSIWALVMLPFFWCGGEYLHALTDLSYPWLTLGNTQTYNNVFIQFIEYTGVWGLSFVLVGHSCLLVGILSLRKVVARPKSVRWTFVLLVLTFLVPYVHGLFAIADTSNWTTRSHFMVTVVQPNINPWDKWKTTDTTDQVRLNTDLSKSAVGKTDMFLWTETAIPTPITEPGNENRLSQALAAVDELNVPVLTGFPDYQIYDRNADIPPSARHGTYNPVTRQLDSIRFDYFNSAGLFIPRVGLKGVYHKMQLVPFGERIPFVDLVPFLIKMLQWDVGISAWGKGTDISVFDVPWKGSSSTSVTSVKVASVVCFESIYPNIVRQFTEKGAQILTVITNDGWYLGTPGPLQHARFAMLRAIENRRPVARAANTGVSCFISDAGQMLSSAPEGERLTLTDGLYPRSELTFYVRHGDYFPQICIAVTLALLGWAAFAGRRTSVASDPSISSPRRK